MASRQTACAVLIFCALAWSASAQEGGQPPAAGFHGELESFDMVDADTGWAAGHTGDAAFLLQSRDGGKTWADISPEPVRSGKTRSALNAEEQIFYRLLDATHGWAAIQPGDQGGAYPDEALYSTADGGHTWQRNSFRSSVGSVAAVQFPDPRHGFILVESDPAMGRSQKATYRTADGGETWQETSEASRQTRTDQSLPAVGLGGEMVFRSDTAGWVSASPRGDQDAFFYRTGDAGKTWQSQVFKAPPEFFRGYARMDLPEFFGDRKTRGVLGVHFIQHDPEQSAYALYRTRDGGERWSRVGFAPSGRHDYSSSFVDENRGWLMADRELLATTDGGAHWQQVPSNLRFGDGEAVAQFYFVGAEVGWLVKSIRGANFRYELLGTTDGGRTWTHRCGPAGELAPPPP